MDYRTVESDYYTGDGAHGWVQYGADGTGVARVRDGPVDVVPTAFSWPT
jgi:hypothetical protein